ncbi:P-type DNA transfer ATPase VirB11 [Campylobacter sp. CNRCH_2013_0671h]|uniref:P-type DNA transfer ATPase VirB11 n=1 Tax=Campylobacter sp. CNRCH_2013_0671h TaxID=2911599 RepID=UPI0021E659F1|nr:P-type DNA transfer ATPase VirB11 [Campylobacter sp. CNRCH_2013_0671h]MCV3549304.1 P-type DNA transfer ATPase VirB11 [Campylobacter sp. CNRCH_2013_0671h]HEC1792084.1 P-type DNA transfer ATPase VirB11 [Campylobacter lari]
MSNSRTLEKLANDFFGEHLANSSVTEICYNGKKNIFIQTNDGKWQEETSKLDYEASKSFATSLASFKEDKIDESRPILSCILHGGERVQVVIPPATKKEHISITIRKPSEKRFLIQDHVKSGLFEEIKTDHFITNPLDEELKKLYEAKNFKDFICKAVEYEKNIIIAGGTGSGKTTFMKTLIDFIPKEQRIITIEDVEEIKFYEHKNFVQLFYPSEAKNEDFLNSATLLKSCLRMKPDRILLAELRGAETYDFINVLSSGHGGSITSCHAGSTSETFERLALMTLQNTQGQKIPFEKIQDMLKNLIDVVVHIRAHNGKRHISQIYFKEMKNGK